MSPKGSSQMSSNQETVGQKDIYYLSFPEVKSVVVCGDIHGDFNEVIGKLCLQYQLENTLLIVAGDCGFGFKEMNYYKAVVRRHNKRLNDSNNWVVFVRGNHDNPAYFDGKVINHKRFIAVPDYSIIQENGFTILCVGGAISIDRQYRIKAWQQRKGRFPSSNAQDHLEPNYYWENERPILDTGKLAVIGDRFKVDTVITHTAPSFCELQCKMGLDWWCLEDRKLEDDVNAERAIMDRLFQYLKDAKHPIFNWCYGHFHQSWHQNVNGTFFKLLDILEFHQLSLR